MDASTVIQTGLERTAVHHEAHVDVGRAVHFRQRSALPGDVGKARHLQGSAIQLQQAVAATPARTTEPVKPRFTAVDAHNRHLVLFLNQPQICPREATAFNRQRSLTARLPMGTDVHRTVHRQVDIRQGQGRERRIVADIQITAGDRAIGNPNRNLGTRTNPDRTAQRNRLTAQVRGPVRMRVDRPVIETSVTHLAWHALGRLAIRPVDPVADSPPVCAHLARPVRTGNDRQRRECASNPNATSLSFHYTLHDLSDFF